MIAFFTGTPGSGKTYEAVEKIVFNLSKGRKVYTNIDGMEDDRCHEAIKSLTGLNDLEFFELFHHLGSYVNKEKEPDLENDPDDKINLAWFWKYCEPGSFIVLDEVQKIFGCRDTRLKHNADFSDWASTHRHNGYDLMIITQNAERVEVGVRSLTEWNYVFRKVNFFGGAVQRKYLCNSYAGEHTDGQPLKKAVRTYKPNIFLCYKSYVSKDIKEQGFMTHVNILNHPIFFAIPLVLGVCLYMFFYKSSFATGDIFGVDKFKASSAKSVPLNKNQPKSSSAVPITPPGNSTPAATPAPQSAPAPAVSAIQTHRVKLNYLQVFHKGQLPEIKILFDHSIYTQQTFPYPITKQNGQLYASIPVTEYTPAERVESIEPSTIASTDK